MESIYHNAGKDNPFLKTFLGVSLATILLFLQNISPALAGDATLTWDANIDTMTVGYIVYYGQAPRSYSTSIDVGNQTAYTITGLGTETYYFAVTAYDGSGNQSDYSNEESKSFVDTIPPVISGITAGNLNSSGASISWTTDEASDSQVQYGTTTAYGSSTALNSTLAASHSQSLTGLQASTLYHYRVLSRDAAGNLATSGDNTFTTLAAPDTTPPVISGIASSSITASGATISWTTNEASDTQVEYGATTAYGSSSALSSSMVTSHSRSLTSLQDSTLYHYRVLSRDAAGNLATSGDNTFTTSPAPDTTPPVISGIAASNLSSSGATISWTTDEASDSQVQYGTTTAYGSSSALSSSMVTSHSRSLTGLQASTPYHYRVLSRDAAGNLATSGDNTFTTSAAPDTTPPIISGIAAGNLTSSGATISWTTDEASDSQVQYGTTMAYGSSSALSSSMVTSHSRSLTGLQASTPYHYRVLSRDAAGNLATSGDNTFTTSPAPDITPPVISGIAASNISNGTATITWATDEAASSQVEYGTTTGYGSSTAFDSTLVTGHGVALVSLAASTTYHYRVKSTDGAGNPATSGDNTFSTSAPPDTTPPIISSVATGNVQYNSAIITWTTNEAASSQVEYGTTTGYGSSTAFDSTLVTGHGVAMASLAASTTYHYRVKSTDGAGNPATSGDSTFTTSAAPDTTPPVVSNVASGNIQYNSAGITWSTNEAASSQVEYGTTTAYGSSTAVNSTLVSSHSMALASLAASTTYHYRVKSADAAGNLATSGDHTFTTSPAPDTTPPVVSGIAANNTTNVGATIVWATNEAASSQVEYGGTTSYGTSTAVNSTLVSSHSMALASLAASTTYHYRVKSADAAGNLATSGDHTFTTSPAPDTAPPAISGVTGTQITATGAAITWTTNEGANTQVEYGPTPSYGSSTTLNTTLVTGHSQTLNGLTSSTTYHFRVKSADATGNLAVSTDDTFTTLPPADTTAPVLSQITAANPTSSSATITWGTDESATTQVEYGIATAYGNTTTLNATLLNSHTQDLAGLNANSLYHYRVRSTDAWGNLAVSSDHSFTTLSVSDTTPPGDVQKFTAHPADKKVTLTWTNPSDSDFMGVRIIYRTDHYPTDVNDGELLGDFTGGSDQKISTIQKDLNNDVTYYYAAHSYDASGNFQSTAYASATPSTLLSDNGTGQQSVSIAGGCGMISPKDGKPPGPGGAADMLAIPGVILIVLLKKRLRVYRPAAISACLLATMGGIRQSIKPSLFLSPIISTPISNFQNPFQILEIFKRHRRADGFIPILLLLCISIGYIALPIRSIEWHDSCLRIPGSILALNPPNETGTFDSAAGCG